MLSITKDKTKEREQDYMRDYYEVVVRTQSSVPSKSNLAVSGQVESGSVEIKVGSTPSVKIKVAKPKAGVVPGAS